MDLVVAFIVLFGLGLSTLFLWRASQHRAADARLEPMQPTMLEPTRASPVAMRAAILSFCAAHPGLLVTDSHGNIHVTWNLPPNPGSIQTDGPVDHTWSVELKVGDAGTVLVRYGDAAVHWSHLEGKSEGEPSLHRIFDWRWDMRADFEHHEPVGEETVRVPEEKPYTSEGLVIPLQRVVLANGWAWQPTLDVTDDVAVARP